jgi:4-hydroxy-3-methylbut-2-enyl diphosphate reductase
MEIRVAKTAGFCFGVKRAVDLTYGLLNEGCKVATLGPLIHNPQAVEDMQKKGALVADAIADVPAGYEVVIRSHGVPRTVYDELDARGITYHDATCPFVQKIQRIAAEAEKAGAVLLVAGDKTHPEVQGIVGHTRGEVFVFADLAYSLKHPESKLYSYNRISTHELHDYYNDNVMSARYMWISPA